MPLYATPTVAFEELSQQLYGSNISQLFLGHSKLIAAGYFKQLINIPKHDGYELISLKAMEGSVIK